MEFNRDRGPRQMYKGDWSCAQCKGPITELPFQPDQARLDQLLCRDCHREKVKSFRRPSFR